MLRSGLIICVMMVIAGSFLWILAPNFSQTNTSEPSALPHETKLKDQERTGQKTSAGQQAELPIEPKKQGLRRVGEIEKSQGAEKQILIERLPPAQIQPTVPPLAKPIFKPVRIIRPIITSANQLEAGEIKIQLAQISAPAINTSCEHEEKSWPCGKLARTALRNFVRGRTLICTGLAATKNERLQASCTTGGKDLALWLVQQGWATSTFQRFEAAQKTAQANKTGLWRHDGTFESNAQKIER